MTEQGDTYAITVAGIMIEGDRTLIAITTPGTVTELDRAQAVELSQALIDCAAQPAAVTVES